MGLEGLVSKHKDRPYRVRRSSHWIKIKNRKHPAMSRVMTRSPDHPGNIFTLHALLRDDLSPTIRAKDPHAG
jgi:hypothetical protein